MRAKARVVLGTGLLVGFAGACGGGGTGPGGSDTSMVPAQPSGDLQSAAAGTVLAQPLRVLVTQSGAPKAGVTVTWGVRAQGGLASPASVVTGADGIAATTVTLPAFAASVKVFAAANGVNGSPVQFTVSATGATSQATIQVENNEFFPDNLQLRAGGSVTFLWLTGAGPHTVSPVAPATVPVSPGDPSTHDAPFSFTADFLSAGTFQYFCRVHGSAGTGMHGTVTVVP